ncbi:anhydro-N-acetylmuramic acid kinase [Sinisalibacter aestuarii]|uniref:Anhydro-N-acetylmuramic acid kinase n=1 Tax=Sinisalibacter aestuarii TaxID=2949426 RepID=A0ABQ5LU96_9RHOB|nr:anhydro-N-acetylmuramic acid kinase [Sinisalibacter aestuarii]GKY88464.1 anhydro-N-acetylmuramic acid kinase [Sinisalibacter aestuarii]
MEPVWAVGLMTGTVLDGNIDVALLKTDGERIEEFGAYTLAPYPDDVQALLVEALAAAQSWNFAATDPAIFARAEAALTGAQSDAVLALIETAGLTPDDVRVIGFHGQTMLHRAPEPGRLGATRQLGDGALMAAHTGIDVVYDFRSADMAAGGQGAPLSAAYHGALLQSIGAGPETAVLNLGGVANFTWAGPDGTLVAFDTGPANAPINDFIRACGLGEMDRDGALATAGRVDEARLAARLQDPYLTQAYPKSLDRYGFGYEWVDGLSPEDGAATLAAFSAAAVGRGLDLLPTRPTRAIVCGGGRHNPALMRALETRAGVAVERADVIGWRGDAVEAECFAFLALRALRGLPYSYPSTTGVPAPMTGGVLAHPAARP